MQPQWQGFDYRGENDVLEDRVERIDLRGQPLSLDLTLASGQAFRWHKLPNGVWSGVVRDKLVELDLGDGFLLWRTYPTNDADLVRDYLRLSDDVDAVYKALSMSDDHLAELIPRFHGLRLLRQDPTETLLSFMCSAANSIPRISASIEAMCRQYGELVCEKENSCYHAFPRVEKLAAVDPYTLAKSGALGFRGANLHMAARQILARGANWLPSLRNVPYSEARAELIEIRGVGAKIADCVCLFALDKDESVPVDTHVRQLAQRFMLPDMKARSVTDTVYRRVHEAFKQRYGRHAGLAQQFLYYEDLIRE